MSIRIFTKNILIKTLGKSYFKLKYQRFKKSNISLSARVNTKASVYYSIISDYAVVESSATIKNSIISSYARISSFTSVADCFIGSYSYISKYSRFSETNIGNFCSIGSNIICGRGDHPTNFISNHPVFYTKRKQCVVSFADKDYFQERKPIIIKNDVWIGDNVFIKDGITIGNGAILATGAVITKDVPDYAIVGGVPAKILRYKFEKDQIDELLAIEWWNWEEQKLRDAQKYFISNDICNAIKVLKMMQLKKINVH